MCDVGGRALHREAARGQLIDDGGAHVAHEGHRDGAGDGRGRHEEDVRGRRVGGLLHELRALPHAKAVLLVNDDEAEAREELLVVVQGGRADHDVDVACRQPLPQAAPPPAPPHGR